MQEQQNNNLVPHFSALFVGILVLISVAGGASFSFSQGAMVAAKRVSPDILFPREPELSAHAYSVNIIGSSRTLLKRRESKKLAPASLTKLLTAFVARQNLAPESSIELSESAKKVGEKSTPAPVGEAFSRDQALNFFLVESVNDLGMALAERVGEAAGKADYSQKIQIFTDAMNTTAAQIGMSDSFFQNPTGLDADGHFTTVNDLSSLVEFLWYNDRALFDITREREAQIVSKQGTFYTAKNTNELLEEFPALRGGKTGFTDSARGALILLYPVRALPGEVASVIILGSDDRFGDGRKLIHWIDSIVVNEPR